MGSQWYFPKEEKEGIGLIMVVGSLDFVHRDNWRGHRERDGKPGARLGI